MAKIENREEVVKPGTLFSCRIWFLFFHENKASAEMAIERLSRSPDLSPGWPASVDIQDIDARARNWERRSGFKLSYTKQHSILMVLECERRKGGVLLIKVLDNNRVGWVTLPKEVNMWDALGRENYVAR